MKHFIFVVVYAARSRDVEIIDQTSGLFIDTPSEEEMFENLKTILRFTRLLGMPEKDGTNSFIRITDRRAIVETNLFGRQRKIKFGLWTDLDPILPWFTNIEDVNVRLMDKPVADIGIHPGDMVMDGSGIYGNLAMEVVKVNPIKRTVRVRTKVGSEVEIELFADKIKVDEGL